MYVHVIYSFTALHSQAIGDISQELTNMMVERVPENICCAYGEIHTVLLPTRSRLFRGLPCGRRDRECESSTENLHSENREYNSIGYLASHQFDLCTS